MSCQSEITPLSVEALPRTMRPSIQPSQQGLVINLASPRSAPARVYSPQIALKLQTFSKVPGSTPQGF